MKDTALNLNEGPLHEGPSSDRVQRLRRKILDAPYEICIERALYYTESYKKTAGEPPAKRAAKALAYTLENMTIYILDDEAIVGNRSSRLVGAIIPIERGDTNAILELDLDRLLKRPERPFHLSYMSRTMLERDILPFWKGKTVRERKKQLWKENGLFFMPYLTPDSIMERIRRFGQKSLSRLSTQSDGDITKQVRGAEELIGNNPGLVMNVFDTQGHLVLGHRNLLPLGFRGVQKHAEDVLKVMRREYRDPAGQAFLEAVIICCEAVRDFAQRFAERADTMARGEGHPDRKMELLAIAERCRRVPYDPPRDFREAVQFVWLTQVVALISYGMAGIFALGRIDQYLYPYYKRDLEQGRITDKDALILIEGLLIKLSYNLLLIPYLGKDTGSELGADGMAITIGGVDRDGEDATNELTYLFLDATAAVRSMVNSVSIRISDKSSEMFLKKVARVLKTTNGPALFNDEAIVPAQVASGYTLEDARDYAIIGCVEPTSDGNTFGCTSGNDISMVGALEMTLNRGKLSMLANQIGPDTGDPRTFSTFEDLMNAYKRQVSACVDIIARATNYKDQAYMELLPCPLISSTLTGCIDNAKDATWGGAQYNFSSISARGLATAADSLAAIKKFVYDERLIGMEQMLDMLADNFKDKEEVRQRLLTQGPKYGRDDDEADAIAREIQEYFCNEVIRHKGARGGNFRPGFFSYGMHVFEGGILSATPDGRKAGEPVSNSLSPSNNTESKGPSGLLKSAAKFNHRLIQNGCSINIKLLPSLVSNEVRRANLVALIRAYFAMGGMHVQFNIIDNQTLIAAQQEPEKYKDLVVRVSGYSAYFVDLGKPVQDDIIARTEFASWS